MASKSKNFGDVYKTLRWWYLIGLLLSVYAFYVEHQAVKDKHYRAMCDISTKMSCTAVFNSPYGKTFGLMHYIYGKKADKLAWNAPNGMLGLGYYFIFFLTTFFAQRYYRWLYVIQLIGCIVTNVLSFYLAYLLYYVLENLCIICVSIYLINLLCLHALYKAAPKIFVTEETRRKKRN